MEKKDVLVNAALSGLLTFAMSDMAFAAKKGHEKCYGIAKAGQNDCGAKDKSHDCSGKAKKDYEAKEWKYAMTGTCKAEQGVVTAEKNLEKAKKALAKAKSLSTKAKK